MSQRNLAINYFKKNPSGFLDLDGYVSNTRLLDILPNKAESYTKLARRFNELPAIVPTAIASGVVAKILNKN